MRTASRRRSAQTAFVASILLFIVGSNVAAQGEADDLAVLEAHNWYLEEAHTTKGEPLPVLMPPGADPITLTFQGHNLSVTGCNTLGERFDLSGRCIVQRHSDSELVTQTLVGCESRRLLADDALLILFNGNPRYELIPSQSDARTPRLVLESPADMIAVFRGEATAEARFGSAGETIWFDIAPRNARCVAPGRADCDCLQVRQLFSPRNGSYSVGLDDVPPEDAGPWQLLCDGIEGLDARADRESGLYLPLRRFRRKTPGGDTAYAYVLFGH
jgi:hypothetical protein